MLLIRRMKNTNTQKRKGNKVSDRWRYFTKVSSHNEINDGIIFDKTK